MAALKERRDKMIKKIFTVLLLLTFAACLAGDCGEAPEKKTATETAPATSAPKSMEDYREEAKKTITKDNAEETLETLKKEIEADL
jgi:hypothetical protein